VLRKLLLLTKEKLRADRNGEQWPLDYDEERVIEQIYEAQDMIWWALGEITY